MFSQTVIKISDGPNQNKINAQISMFFPSPIIHNFLLPHILPKIFIEIDE
jgi:hypothetical protein